MTKAPFAATTGRVAPTLIVTAEPDFAVARQRLIVSRNEIAANTKGGIEPVNVTFQLFARELDSQVQPIDSSVYEVSNDTNRSARSSKCSTNRQRCRRRYTPSASCRRHRICCIREDYYRESQAADPSEPSLAGQLGSRKKPSHDHKARGRRAAEQEQGQRRTGRRRPKLPARARQVAAQARASSGASAAQAAQARPGPATDEQPDNRPR